MIFSYPHLSRSLRGGGGPPPLGCTLLLYGYLAWVICQTWRDGGLWLLLIPAFVLLTRWLDRWFNR